MRRPPWKGWRSKMVYNPSDRKLPERLPNPEQPKQPELAQKPEPVIVMSHDDATQALMRQGKSSMLNVDDFDEASFDTTKTRPAWLPDRIGDVDVHYVAVDKDNPTSHPYYEHSQTITRELFPDEPESRFNGRGFVQTDQLIWMVMPQTRYLKLKAVGRRLSDQRNKALARDVSFLDGEGGGVYSGMKSATRKSLSELA